MVLALAFSLTTRALAHGGEPRIEINADRLNPGGTLDVRGVDFSPEEEVALSLIGTDYEMALGVVTTDVEGIFLHVLVLPVDLAEGIYHLRAVVSDHIVLSPPITIWGTPTSTGGGDGNPREDEDGLLAPMPTFPPATVPAPDSSAEKPSAAGLPMSLVATPVVALIVLGVAVLLGRRMIRGR